MKKMVKNLREKPEEERRHILHITVFVLALILFMLWVFSLGTRFSGPENRREIQEDLEPFNLLKDSIMQNN